MNHLFTLFSEAGFELYLVGGAVRDLCRGQRLADLSDLDFATNARTAEMASLLRSAGLPVFTVGSAYGTLGTLLDRAGKRVDVQITTYRGDLYTPGSRKPVTTLADRLEDDLVRRDFTINAMAQGGDGILVDPWGGRADLRAGRLATVRDPKTTFGEDPLRMLRAARFIARYDLTPAVGLAEQIAGRAQTILSVSRERWLQELTKLLVAPWPERGLAFLRASDLLRYVLPEVQAVADFQAAQGRYHHHGLWNHTMAVLAGAPARLRVRWAALLHDIGKVTTRSEPVPGEVHFYGHGEAGATLVDEVAERLRFDTALHRAVKTLVLHHQRPSLYRPDWNDGTVRRLVRDGGALLDDLLALSEADTAAHHPDVRAIGLARLTELRGRIAAVGEPVRHAPLLPKGVGTSLMTHFRLRPGPEVGRLRSILEQAVLDGTLPQDGPMSLYLHHLEPILSPALAPGLPARE